MREPEPVRVGARWVFPDFAVVHRHQPARRGLLICVDARIGVGEAEVWGEAAVIAFKTRIDVAAVKAWAEGLGPRVILPYTP